MLLNIIFSEASQGIWDNILAAVLILAVGWVWGQIWGQWRSGIAWRKKQFRDRVLLALNMIEDHGDKKLLKLRTLFEKDIHDVFQNATMEQLIKKGIEQAKENDPILRLPQEDAWYVLNAVLNRISEQFAQGLLRKDMGLPVTSKWYIFCLTFEKEGGMRIQKLRIMLTEKSKLENFPDTGDLEVESEKHKGRIGTMRLLKQEFTKNPHLFMKIELSL